MSPRKGKNIIKSVIQKHEQNRKREVSQLSIKIDSRLDFALTTLSSSMKISKNRLIEDILLASGVMEEVEKTMQTKL
ncbi:MAG: hypothetical protein ACK5LP_09945 [Campylobacteraceae bacterium]